MDSVAGVGRRRRGIRCGDRAPGWTILEVMVSVVLVACSLTVIVGIIPMGATSLRKSENHQAAILYANEVVEDAARGDFVPVPADLFQRDVTINGIQYQVAREIYAVDAETPPHLYDVVVRVAWGGQPVPVLLRTRVYHP